MKQYVSIWCSYQNREFLPEHLYLWPTSARKNQTARIHNFIYRTNKTMVIIPTITSSEFPSSLRARCLVTTGGSMGDFGSSLSVPTYTARPLATPSKESLAWSCLLVLETWEHSWLSLFRMKLTCQFKDVSHAKDELIKSRADITTLISSHMIYSIPNTSPSPTLA